MSDICKFCLWMYLFTQSVDNLFEQAKDMFLSMVDDKLANNFPYMA